MSDRTHTFEMDGDAHIDVTSRAGDVILRPAEGNLVTVVLSGDEEIVEGATVDATSRSVSIRTNSKRQNLRSRSVDIVVSAPPGGVLRVGLGAGDVIVQIPMESVDVNLGAGDVRVGEPVNGLRVKIASGDVAVEGTVRQATVTSASGDIRVRDAGNIVVNTASGTVNLGSVATGARVKSASGDVHVRDFDGTTLDVKTMSGDVNVGLAPGAQVAADITTMSGEFRNRIEPSDAEKIRQVELTVKSFSGDVTLRAPW